MNNKFDNFRTVDYNLKEVYSFYKSNVDDNVNYTVFSEVIKSFNKNLIDELYDGTYIQLPYRIGDIYIKKYKPNYKFDEAGNLTNQGQNQMIDYKATNELWAKHPELAHKQRVFYTNDHSDGFKFKIKWKQGRLKNIYIYNFVPAKGLRRSLASHIRNNPNKDYYDN